MSADEPVTKTKVLKHAPKKSLRYWLRVLPGTPYEYFLLTLAAADVVLLFARQSYAEFIAAEWSRAVIAFDFGVLFLWLIDFVARARREKDRLQFVLTHWYEILGMVPVFMVRPLLLLRAAKLAIAFYKLGSSEQDVSRLLTRDITFRFRDVIVDTIADAVFLQSLDRVEEVMVRLDYHKLAQKAFGDHEAKLRDVVNEALHSKSVVGDLSKVPFMSPIANKLGEEVSRVIVEILETEVTGNIMKGITQGILIEMRERVRVLDIERLTGQKFVVGNPAKPRPKSNS
ncbi:MAG: hypothetical protein HY042_09375 [Spirochaetia bacterium]|nr:hypothetical protein [Spirochaetia bacterium]